MTNPDSNNHDFELSPSEFAEYVEALAKKNREAGEISESLFKSTNPDSLEITRRIENAQTGQPAHHGVCACNQCVASRVLERLNAPIKPA